MRVFRQSLAPASGVGSAVHASGTVCRKVEGEARQFQLQYLERMRMVVLDNYRGYLEAANAETGKQNLRQHQHLVPEGPFGADLLDGYKNIFGPPIAGPFPSLPVPESNYS